MNKTIWKYPLQFGQLTIELPRGAAILSVQVQDQQLVLWAIVHPDNEKEDRGIEIVGTGQELNPRRNRRYISTVQIQGTIGLLVLHVFELL